MKNVFIALFLSGLCLGSTTKQNGKMKGFVRLNDSVSIYQFEESNHFYRQFLNQIKGKVSDSLYWERYPDTAMWIKAYDVDFNDPMAEMYFQTAQYAECPVVNIDRDDIDHFLSWRTEYYNSVNKEKVVFRLPTDREWRQACKVFPGKPWPWPSDVPFKEVKGEVVPLANLKCKSYSQEFPIYIDDGAFYPIQVKTYEPNRIGLYQIIGNVAEVTQEGTIKGGGWENTLEESGVHLDLDYTMPHPCVGFRVVVEKLK